MKVSVGTNTTMEINDYQYKKKLSLKPLYMPYYRLNLLFAKTMLLKHELKNNNIDFSNKSIFIYSLKKKNNLEFETKKSNSVKNIYAKLRIKKVNNTNSFKRNLSSYESINDYNNKIIAINNNVQVLSTGNTNNLKKSKLKELYLSKTTSKMNLHLYSPIKKRNLFDIRKKLNFNSDMKINESKEKTKSKIVKFFNKKLNFLINGKIKKKLQTEKK